MGFVMNDPPESLFTSNGVSIFSNQNEWGVFIDSIYPYSDPITLWSGNGSSAINERKQFYGKFISDTIKFTDQVLREQFSITSQEWFLPDIGTGNQSIPVEEIGDATFDPYPMGVKAWWESYWLNTCRIAARFHPSIDDPNELLESRYLSYWDNPAYPNALFNRGNPDFPAQMIWSFQPIQKLTVSGWKTAGAQLDADLGIWSAWTSFGSFPAQMHFSIIGTYRVADYSFFRLIRSRWRYFSLPLTRGNSIREEYGLTEDCVFRCKNGEMTGLETEWFFDTELEQNNTRAGGTYSRPLQLRLMFGSGDTMSNPESMYSESVLIGEIPVTESDVELGSIVDLVPPEGMTHAYIIVCAELDSDVSEIVENASSGIAAKGAEKSVIDTAPASKGSLNHYFPVVYEILSGDQTIPLRIGTQKQWWRFV